MSKPVLEGDFIREFRDLAKRVDSLANEISVPWEWKEGTLLNSWEKHSESSFNQGAFYRQGFDGRVFLRGIVKKTSGAAGTTVFTLPEGYRPNKNMVFSAIRDTASERVTVGSNGNVSYDGASSAVALLSLDGISFWTS